MGDLYLGIDTSNYKTSIAVTDSENDTVYARSEYLEVPLGKRGLRQSEAFFRHSNKLPEYIEGLCSHVKVSSVRAVGVSSRPRRVEGSYMPCFVSGVNAAREIAAVLGIPLYEFSHQEGHAAAVIEDPSAVSDASGDTALLFHLSGGTTEFLHCRMDTSGYELSLIGGTLDISIGQLVDRAGVAMGLPFPSGQYMDETACAFHGEVSRILPSIKIQDGRFNLSGTETKLLRTIEEADASSYAALTRELFEKTGKLLLASAASLAEAHDADRVFMAGGVASSTFIREYIREHHKGYPEILFGKPELSGDNAVGIARLAHRISQNK